MARRLRGLKSGQIETAFSGVRTFCAGFGKTSYADGCREAVRELELRLRLQSPALEGRKLGVLEDQVVRAVKANAVRCARSETVQRQVACRSIGLEVSFAIQKSGKVREELDRGFKLCRKRYETKDFSREGEFISCVAGVDEVVSAFGHRTVYDRKSGDWKAAPRAVNGNGRR